MKRCRSQAFVPLAPLRSERLSTARCFRYACSSGLRSELVMRTGECEAAKLPRRAVLSSIILAISGAVLNPLNSSAEEYDAMTTRRYVATGRPENNGARAVNFDEKKKVFAVSDGLQAQDIKEGVGREVEKGSLVRAQWVISLADGFIVDDTTSTGSVLFRVGAGQVAAGIEGSVLGMKSGGARVVKGPSDAFFTDITSGERTLVPKDSEVFMDILVQQLDPFGR